MGLITFDHAEAPEYWGDVEDGATVPVGYTRASRPLAPSPRHYYRIINPADPRWVRLGTSYREFLGEEVPPPRVPAPPEPEKPPPPKEKPPRKPRKPEPSEVEPYEARAREILPMLDKLARSPSLEVIDRIENELLDLGAEVVKEIKKAKGAEREKFQLLNIRRAIEDIGPLRSSLQQMETAELATRREAARRSFNATLRVVREDLA